MSPLQLTRLVNIIDGSFLFLATTRLLGAFRSGCGSVLTIHVTVILCCVGRMGCMNIEYMGKVSYCNIRNDDVYSAG